jgi:hypothetical protein
MELDKKFHSEMIDVYQAAKAIGYNATYFIQLVSRLGGLAAAKQLIASDVPAEGFHRLWELKRLDLSVEARVLKPEYAALFTEDERKRCVERLAEYGYEV